MLLVCLEGDNLQHMLVMYFNAIVSCINVQFAIQILKPNGNLPKDLHRYAVTSYIEFFLSLNSISELLINLANHADGSLYLTLQGLTWPTGKYM